MSIASNDRPFISVIVPIYNEEQYLAQCITALLRQTYPKGQYEVILIDDESIDNSPTICLEFVEGRYGQLPRITYARISHSGLSAGRNTGIYLAKGDLIAFIDGDAVADAHWLEDLARAFGSDGSIGVVGGQVKVLNKSSKFANFIRKAHYTPVPGEIGIIGTNMAYRREVFYRLGGFFEAFWQRADETALLIHKVLPQYKSKYVLDAIVHHEHPDNLKKWLRERFYNGKFSVWVAQLANDSGYARGFCRQIGKLLGWSAVPLSALSFVSFGFLRLIAFVCLILFASRYFRRRYHTRLKYLVQDRATRGWLMVPLAVMVQLMGMAAEDIGFFRELLIGERIGFSDSISSASERIIRIVSSE